MVFFDGGTSAYSQTVSTTINISFTKIKFESVVPVVAVDDKVNIRRTYPYYKKHNNEVE